MATQAHCAYCFETLSSNLSKQSSLSLHEVEALWKKWNNGSPLPTTADPSDLSPFDSELEDPSVQPDSTYRPAALSRLMAPSPSTTSTSSVQSTASTPSRLSEASSATSKSGSSSRSSFFGQGKRLQTDAARDDGEVEGEVEKSPLFVTWNVVSRSGDTRLRGCIGTFEALDLDEGLRSYALTSALDDTRFKPITLAELASLQVGVTLLTNFEPISTPLDWEIGTHGLRISFTHHGRRYGSTYLPDVAKEQGWSKHETMVSLMRKAGWNGRKEDWEKVDLKVTRYQGRQVRLEWKEWKAWRAWANGEVEM